MAQVDHLAQLARRWQTSCLPFLAAWMIAVCTNSSLAQPVAVQLETRVYALSHTNAETARTQLLAALKNVRLTAQIIADPQGSRLIITASAATHELTDRLLGALESPAANQPKQPAPVVRTPSQPPLPPATKPLQQALRKPRSEMTSVTLRLQQLTATTLHARLEKIAKRPLPLETDDSKHWSRFAMDAGDGTPVIFVANLQTGEVVLKGRAQNVRSWQRIVAAMDTPSTANHATQLVTTDPKAAVKVRQTVAVMSARATNDEKNDGDPKAEENPFGSLLGPVQIETIEGTGILVLRGNPRDVDRVLKIIEDIERLSAVSEPRIEIIELEHVQSKALAAMLQQVFDTSLTKRYGYGRVVIVPLVRPNAILLIASPTTAEKAIEVLRKLDQPGKALSQFEVFRLKHTSAIKAQAVVEKLFEREASDDAPTLGPQALIVADARTNALLVRAGPRDMQEVKAMILEIDNPGSASVNEMRIFKLKHTIATELEEVLQSALERGEDANDSDAPNLTSLLQLVTIDPAGQKQLKSGVLADARITANAGTNSLIVTASADSMPLMEALIAGLDQTPNASAELKVFTIVHGDAVALSQMLQDLFGSQQQGQQQGGGGGNNQNNQRLFDMRISVDERTNSILVTASKDELLVVEAILLRLDGNDIRQRKNHVYRLKNAYAEQLAESLQETLKQERGVLETAPGTTSPFQQLEREVIIVPDISSNSLIISSSPRYYEDIKRLVEELDVQAPMVMIQVLIAEVRLGDTDEFGIELGLQDSLLFDRSLLQNIQRSSVRTVVNDPGGGSTVTEDQRIDAADLFPGFNFGNPGLGLPNGGSTQSLANAGSVAAQSLSSFALGRTNTGLGFGGLVLSASSDSVSMLLRALQQSSRLEILSRPQIMTMDNQTGNVFVGSLVPYITRTDINQLGLRTNDTELRKVGLDLFVTPRISPDGLVVMKVTADKSDLGPVSEGVPISIAPNGTVINSPIINQTFADTTISAVSGQTVVLSGLLTKEDRELHRRVPLLADIPLLGNLFRFDSTTTERTELLIILTPHVINSRHEAEMIKQVESARMNWCLGDVVDIHGPAGLRSRNDRMGAAEAETVYPGMIPDESELMSPEETYIPIPTEALPPIPNSAAAQPEKKKGVSILRLFAKKKNDTTVSQ